MVGCMKNLNIGKFNKRRAFQASKTSQINQSIREHHCWNTSRYCFALKGPTPNQNVWTHLKYVKVEIDVMLCHLKHVFSGPYFKNIQD